MKDAEDAVRAVLDGLRDVDAPAGMEWRVLLAVERRAAQGAGWSWPGRVAAGGAVLAGMVGVALVVASIRGHEPVPRAGRSAAVTVSAPWAAVPSGVEDSSRVQARGSPAVRRGAKRQRDAGSAMDALAVSEMRAPSLVAPPLPQTEQEKLLVRVARRGDLMERAMLDPEMRRKQEMEAKVEFEQFFEPAVTTTTTTKENR